ncbi:MAG: DUF4129 domain-containing protein [Planctomycetota bacterium]
MTGWKLLPPILALAALLPSAAGGELSDPETAVEAGRQALDAQWDLEWYDDEADAFELIDTRQRDYDWEWLSWIGDFFTWLSSFNLDFDFASLLRLLAWLVILAVAAWLIYSIVKAYQRVELYSAEKVETEDDGRTHIERVEALPVAVERRVGDLLGEARRLRSAGDLTMAVVYLYSHQLVQLDRAGMIRLIKGKTNRQYLRELKRASPPETLATTLSDTMLLFERSFFGAHPPDEGKLDRCFAATEAFELAAKGEQA